MKIITIAIIEGDDIKGGQENYSNDLTEKDLKVKLPRVDAVLYTGVHFTKTTRAVSSLIGRVNADSNSSFEEMQNVKHG
jgi:hypothetical protein